MSLSKYYKDSNSFKRETIVKLTPANTTGWQAKSNTSTTTFEPGKIGGPEVADEQPANSPSSEDLNSPSVDNKVTTNANAIEPEPSKSVDLSTYISIAEAEKKADAMYQQGLQDGITKTSEDYGSAINALTSCCEQLDTVRETIINNSSQELMEFALLIAEKIIRISLKEQDQTIVATIEEALLRAVKSDEFTIFIHPDDYETVANKSDDFIAGVSGLSSIVIKTDSTIEKGGAKIESENCIIDATIGSQFAAIREELDKSKK